MIFAILLGNGNQRLQLFLRTVLEISRVSLIITMGHVKYLRRFSIINLYGLGLIINKMNGNEQNGDILTHDKVKNMLKLEELFYNKYLTVELLHELISLYTCSIQSTDQNQSELRNYFLEKIQFVLSRAETLKLLESANTTAASFRATLRISEQQQAEMRNHIKMNKRLMIYNGDNNPREKQMKIDMQLKIMTETQESIKTLSKEVGDADMRIKNETNLIKNIAKDQNEHLEQRLERRRKLKRKRSVDAERTSKDDQPVIRKEELLIAQNQINESVLRITARLTRQLLPGIMENIESESKGRIKNSIRNIHDDY